MEDFSEFHKGIVDTTKANDKYHQTGDGDNEDFGWVQTWLL